MTFAILFFLLTLLAGAVVLITDAGEVDAAD